MFSKNCATYEITQKNMLEPDRPQTAVQYSECPLCAG